MWSFIERGYRKLTNVQKEKLKVDASPYGDNPVFQGFDGNNETEHMAVAFFLVEELDRFQEFSDRDFNCHYQSLNGHRRMLSVFESIRKTLNTNPLNIVQLTKNLGA